MKSDSLLRVALGGNAAFSTLTGVSMLLGAGALASPLGLPSAALAIVGVGLLPFAGVVAWLARAPQRRRVAVLAVSLADLGWVVGTLVLLATPYPETGLGRALAVVVALIVAACAAGQLLGLCQTREGTLPEGVVSST